MTRLAGAATGWHARPDDRLSATEANRTASHLEGLGWRAEAVSVAQALALVEVRDLGVRGMPLVAVLRTAEDAAAFLAAHPERRKAGPRRPAPPWTG